MRKQKRREDKGITLVALVVTIIVLIILAGVTLNVVLDNDGIINKAKQAADDYENAQRDEQEMLGEIEGYIEYAGKTAPIPERYTKSQITTEDDVAEGLVIYEIPEGATVNWTEEVDENGKNQSTITIGESTTNLQETVNQYVWIPVEDINSMVMCKSNTGDSICNLILEGNTLKCTTHPETATDLVGRLYTGVETEKMEGDNKIYSYKMNFSQRDQIYNEEDGNGEPAIVTGNGMQFDGVSSNLEVAGLVAGSKADVFFTQLKDDFKEMVTSVAKNKGFYISRYEVGANGSSKKGQMILTMADTDGTNYLGANMWYGLYRTLRDLDGHKQMIWGCQYDQVVKFIGEEAQVGHSDRNLTTTHALSGQNLIDKIKNIYDLEGNLREQTIEAETNTSRVFRGGFYSGASNGNFNPVSYRIKRKSY